MGAVGWGAAVGIATGLDPAGGVEQEIAEILQQRRKHRKKAPVVEVVKVEEDVEEDIEKDVTAVLQVDACGGGPTVPTEDEEAG